MPRTDGFAALVLVATGCHAGSSAPPPPQPPTGAPVAFIASHVRPGADHRGSFDVRAYNFSAKTLGQYDVMLRYHDASGAVLPIRPGTPFETRFGRLGIGGPEYACKPRSWCSFTIDHVTVPDRATRVDVLADRVLAVASDGVHFEQPDLFRLEGTGWPASVK